MIENSIESDYIHQDNDDDLEENTKKKLIESEFNDNKSRKFVKEEYDSDQPEPMDFNYYQETKIVSPKKTFYEKYEKVSEEKKREFLIYG